MTALSYTRSWTRIASSTRNVGSMIAPSTGCPSIAARTRSANWLRKPLGSTRPNLLDMAVLRLTLAPSQLRSPVGQEHGRTIPLAELDCALQHPRQSIAGRIRVHQTTVMEGGFLMNACSKFVAIPIAGCLLALAPGPPANAAAITTV